MGESYDGRAAVPSISREGVTQKSCVAPLNVKTTLNVKTAKCENPITAKCEKVTLNVKKLR